VHPVTITMYYGLEVTEIDYFLYLSPAENPEYPIDSDWETAYNYYLEGEPEPVVEVRSVPIVEVVEESVVKSVADPDKVNTELVDLQSDPVNILDDGTNLADYEYGDTAIFIDANGDEQEVVVCSPTVNSVSMKGQVSVIFPREIETLTDDIIEQIKAANVI
jgi:hypothetical protein